MSGILKRITLFGEELGLLTRSNTSAAVFAKYLTTRLREAVNRGAYQRIITEWGDRLDQQGKFSNRWVDHNLPKWLQVLEKEDFKSKPLAVLEIGSWEGRSVCFFMTYLPKATLVAVDTWQGGDEHQDYSQLGAIEQQFDGNVRAFGGRVQKAKGTSLAFFLSRPKEQQFDLIYVDGSHAVDDVICDAIKAFECLKVGGILIFDDYTWTYYKNARRNPAAAINAFLQMKKGEYEILAVYNQLILKKTGAETD